MPLDFPANPVNGQAYGAYIYNATVGAWQSKEDPATVAVTSDVAPSSANNGDIWYNTTTGVSYVYYNDGNSGQWVEIVSSAVPNLNTKANLDGGNSFTGTQTFGTPIGLSSGGTNASLTGVNGGVVWSSATALGIIAAGTSGQVLKSNGAAAPSWQTLDLSYLPDAAFKKSVKAATTANITLSGTQTIDGIALVAGDRVLVKNQTTASQNGIYDVASGSWTRPADANLASEMGGAVVNVDSGTQGGQLWTTSFKTTDTLGTTAMNWYRVVDTSYTIPVSQGGTNATTVTGAQTNLQIPLSPNYIINGGFDIWQRGTSFSNPASGSYTADRWKVTHDGTGATRTVTRQTFTPGAAPVAGYESPYFIRYATSVAGSANTYQVILQPIEDVRTFAGQTVTVSFWAKADATRTIFCNLTQYFGVGGSSTVYTPGIPTISVGTAWTRYSFTANVPSISGKTIGSDSSLILEIGMPPATVLTFDFWGVQIELGSVATVFRRNAPSLQAEIAACQRYFVAFGSSKSTSNAFYYGAGSMYQTTLGVASLVLPVEMRVTPTLSFSAANTFQSLSSGANLQISAISQADSSQNVAGVHITTTTAVGNGAGIQLRSNSTTSFIHASAEL